MPNSIPFTGPNSFFTYLGYLAGMLKSIYAYQNGTWLPDANTFISQFPVGYQAIDNFIAQVNQPSGLPGPLIGNLSANLGIIQATAQSVTQQLVQADGGPSFNVSIALAVLEVYRQMRNRGFTIQKCKVTAAASAANNVINTGNGQVVLSVKRVDGLDQENLYAESTLLQCTTDAQPGGTATPGNENFQWTGTQAAPGLLDPSWPQGSGGSASFNAISSLYDNSNGNVLVNGTFESWTGNTPNFWLILQGANAVVQGTDQFFTGSNSMKWIGDGVSKPAVVQQFNSSSNGTGYAIPPQTQFAWATWIFMDHIPSAGTLEVALVDQNGNITTDSFGNQNVCTFNLPALAGGEPQLSSLAAGKSSSSFSSNPYPPADWIPISCVFRSGEVVPTTYFLRYRLIGTALSAGTNLWFDQSAMGLMTILYTSGQSIAVFDGNVHFVAGGSYPLAGGPPDQFLLTTTNDRGGSTNLQTWQTKLFQMYGGPDLLWPSSLSPNVSDSLIIG